MSKFRSNKCAYYGRNIVDEIEAGIHLLCDCNGRCTPTDVLRVVELPETNELRTLVINLAERLEYTIKSSGRGYVILDVIF